MKREILRTKQEVIDWFNSNKHSVLAFDTETNDSLNYYDLKILAFSAYNGENCMVIDLINNPETDEIMNITKLVLIDTKLVIAHNLAFDLKVLRKYGIDLYDTKTEVFCTYVADHLIDERRQHSLKFLANTILGYDTKKYSEVQAKKGSKEYFDYSMNDAVWTYELALLQKPQLKELNMERLFREIEMPFQFCLVDMEINGFLVDKDKIIRTSKELKDAIQNFEVLMLDYLKEPYEMQFQLFSTEAKLCSKINFNSSQQLLKVFKKLNLEVTEKTDSGALSIGKVTLEKHKDNPFVQILQKYKIASKLLQGFFEPLPEYIDGDNCVRAHFNDCGTKTGRLSCNKPNLQQLPKVNKNFPIETRSCFIAHEGCKIVTCDYSGQELRVLTEITKDESLIDSFNKGKDLHLSTANDFFNLGIPEECLYETSKDLETYKKKFKAERDKAKTINFGIAYGKGAYGFSKDFKITEEEAQGILDKYFGAKPKVKESIETCKQFVKTNGYVTSLTGRRRNFDKFQRDADNIYYTNSSFREAFNFLIQGFSADMIRIAIINTKKLIKSHPEWGLKLLATVHDEACYECKEEYVNVVADTIKQEFERAVTLCIPVIAEIGVGDNYGEAK